ncbi:MAG: Asp23/Gls24 family envelope stress response protein [Ruminococcus sp.]|nr:Asp23/Gls24 family envelope stress response protein [Ruminococcus sp.]
MLNTENTMGKISISENYITEIVRHAVCECSGITYADDDNKFRSAVSAITHGRLFKRRGVIIRKDRNGIIIDIHIKVRYGTDIKASVENIVNKVSYDIKRSIGIKISSVNVFVDDMNNLQKGI